MSEQEVSPEQAAFDKKVAEFKSDMQELANKHNVGILAGSFFGENGATGVEAFGNLTSVEQLGLCKVIEQRFM